MAGLFEAWFNNPQAAQRGQPAALDEWQRINAPMLDPTSPYPAATPPQPYTGVRYTRPTSWFNTGVENVQRGMPLPLNVFEHRPPDAIASVRQKPFGRAWYNVLPRYDWGSAGFSYTGGQTWTNPIGAGIVALQRLPVFSPLIGTVVPGVGIMWSNQIIAYGQSGPGGRPIFPQSFLTRILGPIIAPAVSSAPPAINPSLLSHIPVQPSM